MDYKDILAKAEKKFDSLPLFFDGHSRQLKSIPDYDDLLISRLKPSIFSFVKGQHVFLKDIDILRTKLNSFFCSYLNNQDIKTSTLVTFNEYSLQKKEYVPPIEVVVKGALTGTPKHTYIGIDNIENRKKVKFVAEQGHLPYVRFDWRNELPHEDFCMPDDLADYFIDIKIAKETVLKSFYILKNLLAQYNFCLLDICFFLNEAGDVICGEISTDNTKIVYVGDDQSLKDIWDEKGKENAVNKARKLVEILNV